MADRDYFSDDLADDYCSYYAQVADDADMGDSDFKTTKYHAGYPKYFHESR